MDRSIRVALVCTSLNQMGGKTSHLKNMYLGFKNRGINTIIVLSSSLEKENRFFMEKEGIASEDIIFIRRYKKWLFLPFIMNLKNILKKRQANIVHTFQVQSDIFGSIAASLAGIGCLISQQESRIIEENIPGIKRLFYKLANAFIKDSFKKTVVVSEDLKNELISGELRAKDTIAVIHLGVDLADDHKSRDLALSGLKNGRPVIGSIARLNKEKGMERFVEAMPFILADIPGAEFMIVGDGDQKEGLKRHVKKLGLDRKVKFIDAIWDGTVYNVLRGIDIFVMPSLREGCPNALLEALVFARPVVASDIGGIRDIVENGKDGLLVDTADPQLFAQKIAYLCNNADKAVIMGQEGRAKVLGSFNMESEISRYIDLYQEALNNRSGGPA